MQSAGLALAASLPPRRGACVVCVGSVQRPVSVSQHLIQVLGHDCAMIQFNPTTLSSISWGHSVEKLINSTFVGEQTRPTCETTERSREYDSRHGTQHVMRKPDFVREYIQDLTCFVDRNLCQYHSSFILINQKDQYLSRRYFTFSID